MASGSTEDAARDFVTTWARSVRQASIRAHPWQRHLQVFGTPRVGSRRTGSNRPSAGGVDVLAGSPLVRGPSGFALRGRLRVDRAADGAADCRLAESADFIGKEAAGAQTYAWRLSLADVPRPILEEAIRSARNSRHHLDAKAR